MSKASSILSFCENIKIKWKSSSCKTFDNFNLWLWLILWPSSPSGSCRKPVQELAQDQFIRNLPRWRPLRVDFSFIFSSFPHLEDAEHTWIHLEDAVNAENPPKQVIWGDHHQPKQPANSNLCDLGFCQQVPAYYYSSRIFYALFFLSGCIHFNHDLL